MATKEKLHCTWREYDTLRRWIWLCRPKMMRSLYNPIDIWPDKAIGQKRAVASFTRGQDRILLWRCPYGFVREYLEKQCGMKTRWYHKLLWTKRI